MNSTFKTILIIASVLLVLAAIIFISWWMPRSVTMQVSKTVTGYYRGWGQHEKPGFFGRNYFKLVVDEGDGYFEIHLKREGFNTYFGYYQNGVMRERGQCWVEYLENNPEPAFDRHNVLNGDYFAPDGRKISEIRNGTGTQTICSATGVEVWVLELKDGKRFREVLRYANGIIAQDSIYPNCDSYQEVKRFSKDGSLWQTGQLWAGQRQGTWTEYDSAGNIVAQEEHPPK